ncbi:acyltransferase family protein [Nostocaceae cyanobacterium CENA369]|uniref:Acyltransferase family protein n=1 Tax=Dendronalium phyllosphericum CENA369 TaxID=1725256 RepID=A0A8J7I231_9NOST|nr:acyltransferase [Dendronalium phyllosphericum]MBH8573250.1 acyltransferase family protein [Dendronalium phyllosphericum CENA369]
MQEKSSDRSFLLETSPTYNKNRLFSLDLLKALSITAVVSFHSLVLPKITYASSQLAIDTLFSPLRFCVPVFLTIYFLLFEKELVKHPVFTWTTLYKRLNRLLIPTVFWFLVTASLKLINRNPLLEVIASIFNGEIFTGAYYLLIIIQFIPVFILLRSWLNKLLTLIITICLQGLVFIYIYSIPFMPDHDYILEGLRIINRPLFIYWFVYMAFGAFFWKKWSFIVELSKKIPISLKIFLLTSYSLIQFFEFRWSFLIFKSEIPPFEYVNFSCMLSVVVLFLCFASIQENQFPIYIQKLVSLLSKYCLGIFCINGIICQILSSICLQLFAEARFNFYEILSLKLILWFLLLAISLSLSILLNCVGLKAVVR